MFANKPIMRLIRFCGVGADRKLYIQFTHPFR